MKLFSKENDLIKRIMNLILVIWIIVAIIIAYTNAVDLMFDYNKYIYEEYKEIYCETDDENNCQQQYNNELSTEKRNKQRQTKALINSVGNAIIVGSFMFFLNREKKQK